METRKMFFSRRNILKGSAASLAAAALGSSSAAFAQQSSAPTIRPLTGKMTYEEVRNRAREMMIQSARLCLPGMQRTRPLHRSSTWLWRHGCLPRLPS